MRERKEHTKDNQKSIKTLLIAIIVTVAAIAISIFSFLRFYNSYIDKVLYQERLSQMREVTTQLFTGLEDVVTSQWKDVDAFCNYVETGKPADVETMLAFMQKLASMNNMDTNSEKIVAIDNLGRYMTQDGWQGTLDEIDYLLDQPERVSFVSKSMIADESRMYFLKRLPEPVEIEENNQKIQVIYYGISQDMNYLNPYFNCGAYDNSNSVYVLNESGMRLFYNNDNELIKGYNAYTVLQKMEYLHDNSFEEAKTDLEKNGYGYANAVLDGEEYYYALYQMNYAEWTLLFLVPSSHVATNVVSLVNTTVRLILVFAIVLVVIATAIIFLLLQVQKKKAVDAERRNSERLSAALSVAERAEQMATEASRAKSDFLANMSHDIRTPMNAIVGITSLMEHEPGMTDKMETYIQKVQLSSRHLLGLINDILDMSRIESKEVQLNVEEVSLAEQIEQIDSIIRAQANEHEQHFHIHVKEVVHEYLICDGVRLRQICLNLLSNAVKYTPKGGDVVLDLTEVPCEVADHAKFVYTVIDNGYGMAPEFLEHIFEPFTRAENSMTNKVQGTGLGMAITKNIVDLMGGEIHVESQLGKGSRFEVVLTLPINQNVDYEIGASRVLLVSSETQLIRNVKAAMSESAIQFYAVSTEEEAAGWLTQESTDVILLAGCLKNKTLDETVSLLRKIAKNAVLIFCLDYASEEEVQEVLAESDVDGMVLRPFFLSNLAVAIARTRTASVSEEEESHILNGMNFLCAEDNELNAEILKELLHMYGATCTIYPDGEKIVEAFKSVKPDEYDAILMDVQMPNMNGLEATRAIRNSENPLGKEIPIIAMTANAFSEDVQHCLGAGMDAHIAKPLDIDVLEKTLRGFSVGGGRLSRKDRAN